MTALIRFALTQRLLMLLTTLLLIGSGYSAFKQIPIDAFPDVSPTQVKVIVKAAGMPPEEVEARITAPIEVELLGVPQQTMLRSIAKYSLTDITIDFEEGTDIYWARQQIAERLNSIWADLPVGIEGGIAPMTTPLGEMFMFTIEGGDLNLMERRSLLDWVIRPALRTVTGVADVNALGGLARAFSVVPDNALMTARNISMQQLVDALQHNNRNDGAGRLNEGEEALLVRAEGRIKTLADVASIVVGNSRGIPIMVSDIAEVKLGSLTRYGAVSRNGEGEAVEGLVLSLRGANAGQTVADIEKKLEELSSSLPAGVRLDVFYNRGDLVNSALSSVSSALLQAIGLVMILLVLFLGDLRASLVVALVLPLAALFTFIMMHVTGMSANLMSLGGLTIAIGMLVDAAVVVVENILTQFSDKGKSQRLPRLHIVYRATREVAAPVVSGSLIIIIVFLPLLALQGLEGKLFAPVALTIVFALAGSLVLSLTVIPVFSSYLLKQEGFEEPWLSRQLHRLYMPTLKWSIQNSKKVFITTAVMLLVTGVVFMQIGRTFMPTMDEGDIVLQLEKLPSITLEDSVALDMRVQKNILLNVPEVKNIIARVGSDELGLDPMSLNDTDTFLELHSKEQWRMETKEELKEAIREVMAGTPGVAFGFTQPIEMRVSEMLTGTRGDVAIKLFGIDLDLLNRKAEEIETVLKTIQGASDVFTSQNEGMQYLQLTIDRLAAGRLGLDIEQIQQILRAQIEGLSIGIVQEGVRRTPLVIKGDSNSANFDSLQITLPSGGSVPLSSVAKLEKVDGMVSIQREYSRRFVVVRSNVEGRDLVSFVDEAKQAVQNQVELPAGYLMQWGGQFENQQRAAARLALVVPVSLLLIFLLLFTTFGSIRQAVLVFSNIPLAMIGGVFALWLSGEYLSVPASIGFIALLGIAVPNSVVLLSYFNQLRATGMSLAEVIIVGTERRLRPVLMTASLTAFGLLPMLFATGPGSEIQRPLAIVVIGGLVSSTFLTLILLPMLYEIFGEAREE
ncbi:MAG: efflux RND transporter permease subunit [Gammaproteobacteria bacterium]|jgi:heavy metal efflux system protein|nr:efflux RND transporter permease subunit [Gammaproteobacteria bacterium]MBT5825878.1 efflux RND transporter permease subunit [Gammaproteobacteria bacterium]MBT6421315.1 efflux RND transporter permease subunit [Gammaproteobacteria bacterium]MBT6575762.1 efflux RND transporter permease subunit [Gammaproteobacteria bacterium]MBT7436705.1 efflux RND transporter permease subunit [Gammaproteobacteria bacterium]